MGRPHRTGLALLALLWAAGCVSLAPRSRTPSPEARVVPGMPLATFDEDRCGAGSLALVLSAHGETHAAGELEALLPEVPGRGVLSIDMLLAARARGFDAALATGSAAALRGELSAERPAILMLRLLDAPGARRDVYHYVVADGLDPQRGLFRFQFGDGRARWAPLDSLERSWKPAGHALLVARPRAETDATLARAVGLEREGRHAEAEALYREVLAVRPESVRAWVNLGNVAADQERRADAEAAYRRALALDPADRDGLNNLAWLLLEEGARLEEAEALAARAAEQPGPERPLALDTLGRVQLARGRCTDAARALGEALAADSLAEESRAGLRQALQRAEACAPR
jgi:tetratricopeptide (TPR) repeat protein